MLVLTLGVVEEALGGCGEGSEWLPVAIGAWSRLFGWHRLTATADLMFSGRQADRNAFCIDLVSISSVERLWRLELKEHGGLSFD